MKSRTAITSVLCTSTADLNWSAKTKEDRYTVFHVAAYDDRPDVYRHYFRTHPPDKRKALEAEENQKQGKPLEIAAASGKVGCLREMLVAGRGKYVQGLAAAHQAAATHHTYGLRMILDEGTSAYISRLYKCDNALHRALHSAVNWDRRSEEVMATVKLLLDFGVDPNARNHKKQTALHVLIESLQNR